MPASVAGDEIVYVVDRDWHTDISLPVAELGDELQPVAAYFPGARYIDIGFGDREYLLSHDTGLIDMIRALWPGPGAMLVTGLNAPPQEAFGAANVVTLRVSPASIAAIDRQIAGYFTKNAAGKTVPLAQGPYAGSLFFASDATYDALHTCNSWVAETLRDGGLPIATTMVVLAGQVMEETRALAAEMAGRSGPPDGAGAADARAHAPPLAVDAAGPLHP